MPNTNLLLRSTKLVDTPYEIGFHPEREIIKFGCVNPVSCTLGTLIYCFKKLIKKGVQ